MQHRSNGIHHLVSALYACTEWAYLLLMPARKS
jgi:hypothetical protein